MDAELPPDPLSLTPEEKESAAAYLRTTFRLHPISPDELKPPAVVPVPDQTGQPPVKFVILKKEPDEDRPD